MRDLYPQQWLDEGNAVGSAAKCAQLTRARFDAGADGVLLHGSPPRKLAPLLGAWPQHRPAGASARPVNPGF